MIDFLLSPVLIFFSRRLYKKILSKGVGFGFLYLGYLTLLFTLLLVFLSHFLLTPIVKDFFVWVTSTAPEMTITDSGLQTKVVQPYSIRHPAFGLVCVIDTTKTFEELNALDTKAPILVGQKQIIFKSVGRGETRIIELKSLMERVRQAKQPLVLTQQLLLNLLKQFYAMALPVFLAVVLIIFFLWKLAVATFYFLVALVLNLLLKERFAAKNLFSLACFVITPITIMQWMALTAILGFQFKLTAFLSVALTTMYLSYGMFVAGREPKYHI